MERKVLDQKLELLRDKLLSLGEATEKAVKSAMQSLVERDSELARKVIEGDVLINQMELEIDQFSIEIIALQQPAAHDLRFVISVAKITPILERIADHAGNIAESALVLNNEAPTKTFRDLPLMAGIGEEMLRKALVAFTSEDAEASREIIKSDKTIDNSYKKVFAELLGYMLENPTASTSAAHLLFVAKHLERIGDYVKDICELNVYLREAEFIKHSRHE